MKIVRLWALFSLLLISLAGCGGDDMDKVHIRIRNDSDIDIENFWLGAGGVGQETTPYGAISSGHITEYQAHEPVLANYRKMNFVTVDGKQYLDVIYPEKHVGTPELAPGYYTFSYALVNDKPVLTLTKDK
ncbi:hypothetical protein [Herpetosiphon giganteus]|uniref:hypothetical protein n=1 Tax=Herpetosiphon giganteus TaxID=2029754 RepID=UPI00195E43E8|nr:hypothetical protein [Herpetosiphon giganteus]MBM7843847.1 hypothetical protein [Herpetosiphon giganteus]